MSSDTALWIVLVIIATGVAAWWACYTAYNNKKKIEQLGDLFKKVGEIIDEHAEIINHHSEDLKSHQKAIKTIAETSADVIEHQAAFNERVEKRMKKKPTKKV